MKLKLDLQGLYQSLQGTAIFSPASTTYTLPTQDAPNSGKTSTLTEAEDYLSTFPPIEVREATLATLTLKYPSTLNLEGTKFTLRDYQIEGINFLQDRKKCFLVDKPGLGKTLQAACAATLPVVIFCPTYLTYVWYSFLKEVAPVSAQTVTLATGTKAQKIVALASGADWTICNIEMLRSDNEHPENNFVFPDNIKTIIVDEAHHIRGNTSAQSLGATKLSRQPSVEKVFLLTATPVYNRPDDLFAQFRMLDREKFSSYWKFTNDYCTTFQGQFGPKVIGARTSLKPLFESYSLGRTYADVKMQLPDLVQDTILIDPPAEFKAMYKTLKERYYIPGQEVYDNALQVLQALRKMTGPEKLKPMLSLLTDTDALSGTVIFSWYKETARAVAELLEIPCIDGDMSPKDRFKTAKDAQCISATISSMAEGVDLSHLHTVVFFELDYVPGRLYQALSRVRRFGGHDIVHAYYLVVKDTIDEILLKVDTQRTQTINSIVREALA